MNEKVQFIERDGRHAFVVIPIEEWRRIQEELENAEDIRLYDRAKAGEPTTYPAEIVHAILDGANPVKAIREWRRMTQARLAGGAGIDAVYLSQIENGRRTGSPKVLRALAAALAVDVELLLSSTGSDGAEAVFARRLSRCPEHVRRMFSEIDSEVAKWPGVMARIESRGEGKLYRRGDRIFCRLDPKHRNAWIGVRILGVDERLIETVAKVRNRRERSWIYFNDASKIRELVAILRRAHGSAQ